jgi:hypothetical protein
MRVVRCVLAASLCPSRNRGDKPAQQSSTSQLFKVRKCDVRYEEAEGCARPHQDEGGTVLFDCARYKRKLVEFLICEGY